MKIRGMMKISANIVNPVIVIAVSIADNLSMTAATCTVIITVISTVIIMMKIIIQFEFDIIEALSFTSHATRYDFSLIRTKNTTK